ncbi:Acetyltransferase (GNAT) family protein [Maioricimonas rarisocia]|uniref:Acetyltransferase (GNAT) family protein n=1 Tax=Maioricimonas rarisocia TaxID=2528026 RepID=A0A517ZFL7_9PLAN|nr:GNAT family N-acetyltransferase [Maioricimonas rarisocia]QDU41232.1 Acetyltransferase (GNAT) family protein [Maioricimonas rarisocia]
MTSNIECHLLIDGRQWSPTVAGWLHREWYAARGTLLPEMQRQLEQRSNRRSLPLAAVALRDGTAIGTASLVSYECPAVHPEPRCFLADVYVLPPCRGQGVATTLCRWMIETARQLGLPELFVMTARPPLLYKRLGWRVVQENLAGPRARNVTMMVLPLSTEGEAGQEANTAVRTQ